MHAIYVVISAHTHRLYYSQPYFFPFRCFTHNFGRQPMNAKSWLSYMFYSLICCQLFSCWGSCTQGLLRGRLHRLPLHHRRVARDKGQLQGLTISSFPSLSLSSNHTYTKSSFIGKRKKKKEQLQDLQAHQNPLSSKGVHSFTTLEVCGIWTCTSQLAPHAYIFTKRFLVCHWSAFEHAWPEIVSQATTSALIMPSGVR